MSERSNPHIGLHQMVVRCANGYPGAMTAMVRLYGAGGGAWEMVKICDELEIYGSELYVLWNDCLGRSSAKTAWLADRYRAGKISADAIREKIRGNGYRGDPFGFEEMD